jgi:zinc transporter ZupT
MLALALVISVLGLALGPVLRALTGGRRGALLALEVGAMVLVPAILLARVLPHLYDEIGWGAVALALAGFLGLMLLEHRPRAAERMPATRASGDFGAALVVPALLVHSFTDGAALALAFAGPVSPGASAAVGLGLALHRIPEGLFLAVTLVPRVGTRGATLRLALLGAATVAGALGGNHLIAHAPSLVLHGAVAVAVGVMIGLVLHRHAPAPALAP